MQPFPDLIEIKQRRKRLGLTQQELARKAQVSQSLVAKIELGKANPCFSAAKRIFEALEGEGRMREATAAEVMRKRVYSISPADSLRSAVTKLRQHEISQMPVLENGQVVGSVTEAVLLDALARFGPTNEVRKVMTEAPPIVAPEIGVRAVASLLGHCPLVLVARRGRVKGLITRADLLERLPY